MNHEAFGKDSVAKRRRWGCVRKTRANATARCEGPLVAVLGVTWRLDERDGKTEAEWRGKGQGFVKELAGMWGFRGIIIKRKERNEEEEEKRHKQLDKTEKAKYEPHKN